MSDSEPIDNCVDLASETVLRKPCEVSMQAPTTDRQRGACLGQGRKQWSAHSLFPAYLVACNHASTVIGRRRRKKRETHSHRMRIHTHPRCVPFSSVGSARNELGQDHSGPDHARTVRGCSACSLCTEVGKTWRICVPTTKLLWPTQVAVVVIH